MIPEGLTSALGEAGVDSTAGAAGAAAGAAGAAGAAAGAGVAELLESIVAEIIENVLTAADASPSGTAPGTSGVPRSGVNSAPSGAAMAREWEGSSTWHVWNAFTLSEVDEAEVITSTTTTRE